jgi:hypothetical protein
VIFFTFPLAFLALLAFICSFTCASFMSYVTVLPLYAYACRLKQQLTVYSQTFQMIGIKGTWMPEMSTNYR